jgi:hypothetical protein
MRSLGPETKDVKEWHMKTVCEYLETLSLNSVRSFKTAMMPGLVYYLRNTVLSEKTGLRLAPATVYEIIGTAIWMHSRMRGATGEHMPTRPEMGVFKSRKDQHNPIDFNKYPNYSGNRDTISNYLHTNSERWVAVAHDLGRAFGLRLAERIGTRGDTITKTLDGKLMLNSVMGKSREVQPKDLARIYGDASYATSAKFVEHGKEYLIIEWGKGSLGRYSEIYTDGRREALVAFRSEVKIQNTKSGRIIPDRIGPTRPELKEAKAHATKNNSAAGYDKIGAVKHLGNQFDYTKNKLGFGYIKGAPRDENNYAYTTNGDRHHDVQQQILDGRTDREIIIEKGHFDTDKLAFYRKK